MRTTPGLRAGRHSRKEVAPEGRGGVRPGPRRTRGVHRRREVVFIGQPNNPTGLCVEAKELRGLARRHPAALFIVDEAFADFVDGIDRLVSDRPENIIVLGSLTKFYAIPGLRLGFAAGSPGRIGVLRRMMPPWDGKQPGPGRGRGGPSRQGF